MLRLHIGSAGVIDYYTNTPQYFDGSILTGTMGAYQLKHSDGSVDSYLQSYTNQSGQIYYFLTSRSDPAGNSLNFFYSISNNCIRMVRVTDPDSRSTTFDYGNTNIDCTNLITGVNGPFGSATLVYDDIGAPTNIIDSISITNQLDYIDGRAVALTTPYGTTSFVYGGRDDQSENFFPDTNAANRYVEITLPTGGKHLYLYREAGADVPGGPTLPSTYPLSNTFESEGENADRNSFHWGPLQFPYLSTNNYDFLTNSDYAIGTQRHWLMDTNQDVWNALSFERASSPDWGLTPGAVTWYDYAGKPATNTAFQGTNALPLYIANILPDGSTHFTRFDRNFRMRVSSEIETYSLANGSRGFRTNSFTYTDGIDLVQQIGPNSEQVVSNYFNDHHQVLASYDALNQETLFTYNDYHQLTSTKRPSGLTVTNVYSGTGDYLNWLSQTIDLEINRTNTYSYANGLVYSHTDERGLTATNYWDAMARLLGTVYPDGTSISNRYTALDITARKDRLGYWTYAGFNEVRQKVAETNANGTITRYGYCECGALMAQTNAWNTAIQQVTTFDYDLQGNRTYIFGQDGYNVTNGFNSLRQLYFTTDGTIGRYLYYNNQGLVTNVSNALGAERQVVYDNEDRPVYVTDANGVTITNTFDLLSRVQTRGYPDAGIESFGYSARGLIAYTNQIGNSNFWAYDAAGRKTFETNANHEILQFTYNAAGDLLSLTDGKTQTTTWHWDEYGRTTNKLDQANAEIFRWTYDPNNRLTNRWTLAKSNTRYSYDPVGNLTNINYNVSPDVALTYDPLNRLINMVDAVGTNVYTYTSANQLLTEDGPFDSDTVTNAYSNRLRTNLSLQQPTGVWTNKFVYDPSRRLTNVVSPAGSFRYLFPSGSATRQVAELLLPNSSWITNNYDSVGRLLYTALLSSTPLTLDYAGYAYNLAGQRTNFVIGSGTTYSFTYDKIGQLTVANSTSDSEDRGYTYDSAWNLNYRTNNGSLSTFTVDSKNQLTSAFTQSDSYDQNGNLTFANDGHNAYVYDDENRLIQWFHYQVSAASRSSGDQRTDFVYDGFGRLRKRLEYSLFCPSPPPEPGPQLGGAQPNSGGGGDGCLWSLPNETDYVYDGMRVIQERDGNNTPTVSYTRGTDLSGNMEGAGGIGGLLGRSSGYSSGNWTTNNFYHADGNGNITYLENSSQGLAASYRYDPFGNTISSSGPLANANVYRFSSKEIHANSGMYYYGFRFYDPNFQRWINRDPIAERGGLNLYLFVANSPPNLADLLGLIIAFDPSADSNFRCKVLAALNLLAKSPLGVELLERAANSPFTLTIKPMPEQEDPEDEGAEEYGTLGAKDDPELHGNAILYLDPFSNNGASPLQNALGGIMGEVPPNDAAGGAADIAHELGHAFSADEGEAVLKFENPVRNDLQVPGPEGVPGAPRTHYRGVPVGPFPVP